MKNKIFEKIFVGIQSRCDSSRFPEKAFAPILGVPLIIRVIQRIQKINIPLQIALLTPKKDSKTFKAFLKDHHCSIPVFGGSENHVLERYYLAGKEFGLKTNDLIIRVTGDNPLISIILCEKLIELHDQYDLSHFLGNPLGTGIEIIKFEALEKSYIKSKNPFEWEHVTQYIYKNREQFSVFEPESPYLTKTFKHLSIDHPEDIALIESLLTINPDWDLSDLE
ncbi:MAG: cytidylyltransferase domain-containing protein [Brevinema sp.]